MLQYKNHLGLKSEGIGGMNGCIRRMMNRRVHILAIAALIGLAGIKSAEAGLLAVTPVNSGGEVSGPAVVDNDSIFGFSAVEFGPLVSTPSGAGSLVIDAVLTSGGGFTSGALAITGTGPNYLSGTLADVGFAFEPSGDDTLQLLFNSNSGTAQSAYGSLVLASFTGNLDSGGTSDFFSDGVVFADAIFELVSVTQIPTPGTLALLVAALIGLIWLNEFRGYYKSR
jgi:hypothetical protein